MKAAIWTLNAILGAFLLLTIVGYSMSYKMLKDPVGWTNKFIDKMEEKFEEGEQ
jgi:hypothetical protein